jgi:hypothetical protein
LGPVHRGLRQQRQRHAVHRLARWLQGARQIRLRKSPYAA